MITYKSKYNAQKFSGYSNERFHPGHSSVDIFLILLMHDSTFAHNIDGRKKQQLPHQGTSSFRDMPLPLMFSGTNLEKVKTGNKGFHQDVPVEDVIIEKAEIV